MEDLAEWRRPDMRSQMAPTYADFPSTQIRQPQIDTMQSFTLFPQLPPEIKSIIWREALTPRLIKWTRIDGRNVFTVPSESFPLYSVCRESRKVVMLYGEYRNISTDTTPLYFSPLVDYLFFDAGWINLVRDGPLPAYIPPTINVPLPAFVLPGPHLLNGPPPITGSQFAPGAIWSQDPLDAILPDFADIRRIMVHPNFTDERKRPRALFGRLTKLEQVLIGADEKSMGVQNKFILSTVYDTKMYYAAHVRKDNPQAKVPHMAIGCLGWRGAERMSMHHGAEDKRQLVGIFEKQSEMSEHLRSVRDEERRFLEDSFKMKRPKLTLKLRAVSKEEEITDATTAGTDLEEDIEMEEQPPSYSSVSEQVHENEMNQVDDLAAASDQFNERISTRPGTWGNKILRGQILSLGNSSTVIVQKQ